MQSDCKLRAKLMQRQIKHCFLFIFVSLRQIPASKRKLSMRTLSWRTCCKNECYANLTTAHRELSFRLVQNIDCLDFLFHVVIVQGPFFPTILISTWYPTYQDAFLAYEKSQFLVESSKITLFFMLIYA